MYNFTKIITVCFPLLAFVLLIASAQTLLAQTKAQKTKSGNPPRSAAAAKNYGKTGGQYHGNAPHVHQPMQEPLASADFGYPDPRFVRPPERIYTGTPPAIGNQDRYSKIPEIAVQRRIEAERYMWEVYGAKPVKAEDCPLCVDSPQTPCGKCKMCQAGFPCERTLCRHCIQQRSQNMCNNCDLTAGDTPCGTCDACREHRSDPCEHADDGHGVKGEFNPYKEPRFLSVIPRPIMDMYNNGARKFPVYYNPAPYYRPHWNPAIFTGYARPYSFRWSCPLCYKNPCDCSKPGFAGQVPYAYSCKFCNRNPCACALDICNVTKELNPKGIGGSLNVDEKSRSSNPQDNEARRKAAAEERARQRAALTDAEDEPEQTPKKKSPLLDEIDDEDLTPLKDAPK